MLKKRYSNLFCSGRYSKKEFSINFANFFFNFLNLILPFIKLSVSIECIGKFFIEHEKKKRLCYTVYSVKTQSKENPWRVFTKICSERKGSTY